MSRSKRSELDARVVPDGGWHEVVRIHAFPFTTGIWSDPRCVDQITAREGWARSRECRNTPGFVIGAKVAG